MQTIFKFKLWLCVFFITQHCSHFTGHFKTSFPLRLGYVWKSSSQLFWVGPLLKAQYEPWMTMTSSQYLTCTSPVSQGILNGPVEWLKDINFIQVLISSRTLNEIWPHKLKFLHRLLNYFKLKRIHLKKLSCSV